MKNKFLLWRINYQHYLVLVIFSLIINLNGITQTNLVPNPSFEQYTVCPGGNFSVGCSNWYSSISTNFTSYSYNNICSPSKFGGVPFNNATRSGRYPHFGNAYASLITYWNSNVRNYIQASLLDTLKSNKDYYVEFYISYPTAYLYGVNNLGLLIGDTAIVSNNRYVPANPQILPYGNPTMKDTLNWIKISGIYQAHGGEKYITLGNFSDNAHTLTDTVTKPIIPYYNGGGYYIDDVSVIPLDSMFLQAVAGRDTSIYKGDNVFIGSRICGLTNVQWVDSLGNTIATNVPGLWVKPNTPSYYIITQNVGGQYSTDTVHIGVMQKLPVTLVRFNAKHISSFNPSRDGGKELVAVQWESATEINSSHFIVERSINGKDFNKIATIKTKGAGVYEYVDTVPFFTPSRDGGVFYRLKMVDKDGSFSYSKVVSVQITSLKEIMVYPNPTSGEVNVQLPIENNNKYNILVTDMYGRELNKVMSVSSKYHFNLEGKSGVYLINIYNCNTGKNEIKRVSLNK